MRHPNWGKSQPKHLPPLVVQSNRDEASEILKRGHYLGALEYQPAHVFVTPDRDAVAVYTHPIASHFKGKIGFYPLELARLWQSNEQTRPLSTFLSQTLRALRTLDKSIDCVFSYTDPAQTNVFGEHHHGGIYRACNFAMLGESRATDHWLTPDGEKISAPKLYRMHKTKSRDKAAELHPDWTLVPGVPKILYVYPLASSALDVCRIIGGRYKSPVKW